MSARSEMILAAGRAYLGTPFRHQAGLRGVGCDCLGLVRGVLSDARGDPPVPAPAYARDWAGATTAERLLDGLAAHLDAIDPASAGPGDVVVFRWRAHWPANHAAILSGPDRIIHAHEGASVAEIALPRAWSRKIVAAFRFPI
jgi:NlpC/P60 family putative phage cell wall peptidase